MVLVQGPPRCGLSTMTRQLAASSPSGALTVDARCREGRALLASPATQSAARPMLLDNADAADARGLAARLAEAAQALEGRFPRFVLVGGPFDAGPAPALEAGPLSLFEVGCASYKRLWFRGGYPEAFGAESDEAAAAWLEGYAADLAHGSLAAWGLPREPELIVRLLETVASANGGAFNENAAARRLGVSRPTVSRYLGILERAGILLSVPSITGLEPGTVSLPPSARLAKSPALYVRDSGLLHALAGIRSADGLAQNPCAAAASWTGFVVEQARKILPADAGLYRFASADGAALDLVIVKGGVPVMVAAARRHRPASVERSVSYAARALEASRPGRFIVVPEADGRRLPGGFFAIGLGTFLEKLAAITA